MGHIGMRYSLPSRDIIADAVEIMLEAHRFDAAVFITNCNKIVPGMLMAAARVDIPPIFINGAPSLAGTFKGRKIDLKDLFEVVEAAKRGTMSEEELNEIGRCAMPTCGSCAGLFTANTMNILTEALGLVLPGSSTIPAVDRRRIHVARNAGRCVMKLLEKNVCPSDILTEDAFENAIAVDMALGGSTNTILHLIAIAKCAGVELSLQTFDEISRKVPTITALSPSGPYHLEDLDRAGGVPAVLKVLGDAGLIKKNCLTVTGKTVWENVKDARVGNTDIIRPVSNSVRREGGIAILYGTLAPEGAVVKQSAVSKSMLKFKGVARVFNSEEEALNVVVDGDNKRG